MNTEETKQAAVTPEPVEIYVWVHPDGTVYSKKEAPQSPQVMERYSFRLRRATIHPEEAKALSPPLKFSNALETGRSGTGAPSSSATDSATLKSPTRSMSENTTDTPITDAVFAGWIESHPAKTSHANLERKLAEAQKQRDRLADALDDIRTESPAATVPQWILDRIDKALTTRNH